MPRRPTRGAAHPPLNVANLLTQQYRGRFRGGCRPLFRRSKRAHASASSTKSYAHAADCFVSRSHKHSFGCGPRTVCRHTPNTTSLGRNHAYRLPITASLSRRAKAETRAPSTRAPSTRAPSTRAPSTTLIPRSSIDLAIRAPLGPLRANAVHSRLSRKFLDHSDRLSRRDKRLELCPQHGNAESLGKLAIKRFRRNTGRANERPDHFDQLSS